MSHSITKIWIHGVFSTKDRKPIITPGFEDKLHAHIKDTLTNQFNCTVRVINGACDHIHILFLLDNMYSIQEIFHQVKGESSHWVNQNNFIPGKFAWQIGYGAFSISESLLDIVEKYIRCQKEHHCKKSFADELDEFIKKYDLQKVNR
jgi:REP element-mobilizing transposase RayT